MDNRKRSIWFPDELWERMERVVPDRQRSQFIRDALDAALKPLEMEARIRALERELRKGG